MDKNIVSTEQKDNAPLYSDKDGWHLNFDFTLDSVIIVSLLAFAVWRKFLRPMLVEKFYWVINPFEEERKIPILLAQVQAVADAKCVMIGTFHNGEVDSRGYHLKKYSVIYHWCDDSLNQKYLPANLLIDSLSPAMKRAMESNQWVHMHINDDCDEECQSYLKENNLCALSMRLIKMGNIPIGLLTIQYDCDDIDNSIKTQGCYGNAVIEELFLQLQGLMKRRFQHSLQNANIFKRLFQS